MFLDFFGEALNDRWCWCELLLDKSRSSFFHCCEDLICWACTAGVSMSSLRVERLVFEGGCYSSLYLKETDPLVWAQFWQFELTVRTFPLSHIDTWHPRWWDPIHVIIYISPQSANANMQDVFSLRNLRHHKWAGEKRTAGKTLQQDQDCSTSAKDDWLKTLWTSKLLRLFVKINKIDTILP